MLHSLSIHLDSLTCPFILKPNNPMKIILMSLKDLDHLDFDFLGKSFGLMLQSKTCYKNNLMPLLGPFLVDSCIFRGKTTLMLLAHKAVASFTLLQQRYPCSVVLLPNMLCTPTLTANIQLSRKRFCVRTCQVEFCKPKSQSLLQGFTIFSKIFFIALLDISA